MYDMARANIAYINQYIMVGSLYKHYEMLIKNHNVEVVKYLREISVIPDIAVVGGDHWQSYKEPLKADIPYIISEHDIFTLRTGKDEEFEREQLENATAVIFTSEDHYEYCFKRYKLPPHEIIHLKPLRANLEFEPKPKLEGKHLVYAGGIVVKSKKHDWYGYRAYHEIFQSFMNAGWTVHVYPHGGINYTQKEYERMGCVIHESLEYKDLLQDMSQYTAGLQSYNKDGVPEMAYNYTQVCRPNKGWDYLAAGIPTIGYNPGNVRQVYEGKWGLVIDDLEYETLVDLDKRLPEISESVRQEEVMDNDLYKFERLVEIALSKKKEKIRIEYSPRYGDDYKVIVKNTSNKVVDRCNHIFQPGEMRFITLNKDEYKQISACRSLEVTKKEDYEHMNSEKKRIIVTNNSQKNLLRGNRLFKSRSTSSPIEVNFYQYVEIKACVSLEITEIKETDNPIIENENKKIELIKPDITREEAIEYLDETYKKTDIIKQAQLYSVPKYWELSKQELIDSLVNILIPEEKKDEIKQGESK